MITYQSFHRFWWRDTRLAELTQTVPRSSVFPTSTFHFPSPLPTSDSTTTRRPSLPVAGTSEPDYQFPYPTTFLPVPYHTDTTLPSLYKEIIPSARSTRSVTVDVPVLFNVTPGAALNANDGTMEVDMTSSNDTLGNTNPSTTAPRTIETDVVADGLLLYVSEASYEMGTSPLSSWIPISGDVADWEKDGTEGGRQEGSDLDAGRRTMDGPLDLFQRCVDISGCPDGI